MSSQPEMLINQAQGAYDDAKRLRRMIEDRQRADNLNIENAYETAESERQSGDEAQERYWKERAEFIKKEMNKAVDTLESQADSKEQEGKRYESEARSLAEKESDDKKRGWIMAALQGLSSNR